MDLFKHPCCNMLLTAAPEDKARGVVDLPAWRSTRELPDGAGNMVKVHVVESFWKPQPEELSCLLNGGAVILCCVGTTAPPVMLMTTPAV